MMKLSAKHEKETAMKRLTTLPTMFLLLTLASYSVQAQDGYDVLQQALVKERTEGDLEGAIRIYERIVERFADNRALAAEALVRAGQCYEKLGRTEARKAYEQVLRDYADQEEQVAAARTRLAALPGSNEDESRFVIRQVWAAPDLDIEGTVSPDGRYLVYDDVVTDDLCVRDLTTGENRRLTQNKPPYREGIQTAQISPDSRWVAYSWRTLDGVSELRIMGIDDSEARVVGSYPDVDRIQPEGWSADRKHVLASFLRSKDGTTQIAWVSVADGSTRTLRTLNWGYPDVFLSPDGRSIAYDVAPDESARQSDVFLLAADGTRQVTLVEHPADDDVLGWTPDGKAILFESDRSGTVDAWLIQVADGKPQGSPQLVKKNIGDITGRGFTRDGLFYYDTTTVMRDVYVADFDPTTGRVLASPRKLSDRFVGSTRSPAWSPDGQYFAFVSGGMSEENRTSTLIIRDVETGEERELSLTPKLYPRPGRFAGAALRWFSDGRAILLIGRGESGEYGVYQIDAQTGGVTLVMPMTTRGTYIGQAVPSLDAREIFYTRGEVASQIHCIVRRNLATREERELYCAERPAWLADLLALSPDGGQLVFLEENVRGEQAYPYPEDTLESVLKVIPITGGAPRELLRVNVEELEDRISRSAGLAWTSDGREVLFGINERIDSQVQAHGLWRIALAGGEPQKLGVVMESLRGIRVHPNGRQIAFSARQKTEAVWVMENFLPEGNSENRR